MNGNGFQAPNYTQVPNDYFDLVMEMTIAEIRVLSALIRVTLGYHHDEITLTIREMARITNLDPKSVMASASKLEERGLIERTVGKITTVTKWRVVIGDTKLWEKIVKTVGNDSEEKSHLPFNKKKKSKEKSQQHSNGRNNKNNCNIYGINHLPGNDRSKCKTGSAVET